MIGFIEVGAAGSLMVVYAHSGRTDAQGGHHDYKNKSGLGSYHYHHGYPAHLHPNGVCSYVSTAAVNTKPEVTVPELKLTDYQLVFDASFYYQNQLDLQGTLGNDEQVLLTHFVNYGMTEGRQGCSNFDAMVYRDNNPDLKAIYGDNLKNYYEHFIRSGSQENRICN